MNRIVIGFLAVAALCSCQMRNPMLHQEKEKFPVRVRVMTVAPAGSICRNTYMGEFVPAREVTLTAPYPGTLRSLNFGRGSAVNANDVVAEICSQQVESSHSIAAADLEQAQDAMDRVEKVYAGGSVTDVQLKDIRTKLEKARATMAAADKAVADCSLKAPYGGVVSEIYPSVGEDIAPGGKVLRITDVSDLKINISVHENEIGSVKPGMAAFVDIPALGIERAPARVIERGVLSSSLAHSYLCALKMDVTPRGLMPGMAAKVRFESRDDAGRIVIPAAAVQIDSYGKYVWVSDSCGVEKRHIVPGGYSGKGVIISEGLREGDKVIIEGYQKVSGGMKITEVE